jgi:putative DNA methylase
VKSGAGKVRLIEVHELGQDWNPDEATTVTIWEATHQIVRSMDPQIGGGEAEAGRLAGQLGGDMSDRCKDLAYRLYSICETQGWAEQALAYNGLVQAWPGILAEAGARQGPVQASF